MKPRDHSVPAPMPANRAAGALPHEIPDDTDVDAIELDTSDLDAGGPPRLPHHALDTAEIDWSRDRRVTVTSMIPAQIAAEMLAARQAESGGAPLSAGARDPAAPEPDRVPARREDEQHTRRVGDSDRQPLSAGSGRVGEPDGAARRRQRAAGLIDRARAALDDGDLTTAVDAAEGALREADEAPPPGIVEVIEPARPLLTRVFAAYVGALSEVPVLAPRAAEIARERLGDRERALIGRIDGLRTLQELFDGSGLGSTDALRIAARLIRTGAIRVI
jgi:hypothetical protein